MRALVTVGDYELPEPSTYSGNTSTLVDSSRNVEGRMIGAVVRDNVGKIELSWLPVDGFPGPGSVQRGNPQAHL